MKPRLPSIFYEDMPRKLVALFFAILIWLAVERQLHEFETFHGVPVNLQYDPDDIAIDEAQLVRVDITLRGARKRLQSVKSSDLKVVAKVDPIPRGIFFYDLRVLPENIRCPLGTRVSEISPAKVALPVDRIIEKRSVPVRVKFEGEPPEGYKLVRDVVSPPSVTLRGPSKLVEALRMVEVRRIPLENAVRDFQVDDVALEGLNPQVHVHPERVSVRVEIAKQSGEQVFPNLEVQVLTRTESPVGLEGALPEVSVTLRGPRAVLDALDRRCIHPFVDILAITSPGRYRRPVRVWIDGAASVTPEYVSPSVLDIALTTTNRGRTTPAVPPGEPAGLGFPQTDTVP